MKDFHRAMSVDGLVTSRPIVAQNINTKEEIDALFDDISYAKGACIIRMIRTFAGDNAFQLGLKVNHFVIQTKRRCYFSEEESRTCKTLRVEIFREILYFLA